MINMGLISFLKNKFSKKNKESESLEKEESSLSSLEEISEEVPLESTVEKEENSAVAETQEEERTSPSTPDVAVEERTLEEPAKENFKKEKRENVAQKEEKEQVNEKSDNESGMSSEEKYVAGLDKSRLFFTERLKKLAKSNKVINQDYFDNLERILIEADVGVNLSIELIQQTAKEAAVENITDTVALNDLLIDKMFISYVNQGGTFSTDIAFKEGEPTVLFMCGVNGVGKTTTVINLAYNLSAKGKRVLMVDTDPQANATYIYSKVNESTRTLLDIFHGKKTISCIYRTKYPNLDLIKGSPRMEEADGLPLIIKEALKQVEDRYDYAIIDCHPSMQLPTIAALVTADELLIPYEPDVFGKTGLNFLSDYIAQIQEIYNPGLTYHVFIAKYAERKSQLEEIYDLIERYQFPMLETVVRNRVSVNSANKARKPLARHRRFDAATKDYEDLTKEVLALME